MIQLQIPLERRARGYPVNPGARNPTGTSAQAAVKARTGKDAVYADILLALFTWGPLTADEISDAQVRNVLSIRPRVSELRKTVLEDTGSKRPSSLGNPMSVLQVRDKYRHWETADIVREHYKILEARA